MIQYLTQQSQTLFKVNKKPAEAGLVWLQIRIY